VINVPEKTRVNVDTSGNIYANDQLLGKLAIKEFNDTHALRKEEAQVFSNANPENINPDLKNTSVHQGFVEESNVNAVSEMSELIKAHRHFETIQKAIQAYDSINVRAVNDISKF
jgi:flagellar basal-body rod protein FlgF